MGNAPGSYNDMQHDGILIYRLYQEHVRRTIHQQRIVGRGCLGLTVLVVPLLIWLGHSSQRLENGIFSAAVFFGAYICSVMVSWVNAMRLQRGDPLLLVGRVVAKRKKLDGRPPAWFNILLDIDLAYHITAEGEYRHATVRTPQTFRVDRLYFNNLKVGDETSIICTADGMYYAALHTLLLQQRELGIAD